MTAFYNEEEQQRRSGAPSMRVDEVGRTAFRKDFGRLLHAASFRRLQGKTQLFPGIESDFFRNRLTHSLEVAHIACGIAARLNKTEVEKYFPGELINEDLVEFAAIAHDLGHPPFGHNGEKALDEMMREYGGFEGNAQTLRILTTVERKLCTRSDGTVGSDFGLDLTYRALASVLKYDDPIPSVRDSHDKVRKGYYSTESELVAAIKARVAPRRMPSQPFKTIECSIMDIADDIAYSTYDLEDSLHAKFVTPLSIANALAKDSAIRKEVKDKTNNTLSKAGLPLINDLDLLPIIIQVFGSTLPPRVTATIDHAVKAALANQTPVPPSALQALYINLQARATDQTFTGNSLHRSQFTSQRIGKLISAVHLEPNGEYPQLSGVRMDRAELLEVEVMKHLNYELVIRSAELAVVEHRGKAVVQRIFKAIVASEGMLLPYDWRAHYAAGAAKDETHSRRVVCDYVAGMTDRYAAEFYNRLFGDGPTMFKPL